MKNQTRAARERICGEGVEAAVQAMIEICKDKTAPAPARATAGAALLRAAGFYEKVDNPDEKDPAEMTPEELSEAIARLEREAGDRQA